LLHSVLQAPVSTFVAGSLSHEKHSKGWCVEKVHGECAWNGTELMSIDM